jgi:hypothetical protein
MPLDGDIRDYLPREPRPERPGTIFDFYLLWLRVYVTAYLQMMGQW